ncbi:MAG: DUF1045 domain-containing protein [Pseudomonadota bacterium]
MQTWRRYAIYVVPDGPLGGFGAKWLGWDTINGRPADPPKIDGLPRPISDLTERPRKYGLHGTLKPPFRLAEGTTEAELHHAARAFCAAMPAVKLDGLRLARLGRFLALVPDGPAFELANLASTVVRALDRFRAPPGAAEPGRRDAGKLSRAQQAMLAQWGYPYVMEEFRFHVTLTGALSEKEAETTTAALAPHVMPLLPRPFAIDSLCLCGQDERGRFHLLHRFALKS